MIRLVPIQARDIAITATSPLLPVEVPNVAPSALVTIEAALKEAGASIADVVRTRVYLTNMGDLEVVAKAHVEYFGDVRPASTGVEVTALARPELIVEIEADAIIG